MFFGHVTKIEVTKNKETTNELLKAGWALLRIMETSDHEFVFLLALCDRPVTELLGDGSPARKAC